MTAVEFTSLLSRHVACDKIDASGETVKAVIEDVFQQFPAVKSYIVDDQGKPRHHIVIFLNGKPVVDREGMSDAVGDDDQIFVYQALSGG